MMTSGAKPNPQPYRVFLCEDEPLLLLSLQRKIEKSGQNFEVVGTAQNGREALTLLSEIQSDVLITDIRMPVMDGMELLKSITEMNFGVLCMLLSGHSEFEYARSALRMGAIDYLLKPVSQTELDQALAKIKIQLDKRREEQAQTLPPLPGAQLEETLEIMRLFIQTNAFNEISISALADSLNYSTAHITRLFAKRYGEPPQRYQTILRMNEAKRLLREQKELSIRQIAEYVGYQDAGYFGRIFRQFTMRTPQQFRDAE